MMLLRLHGKCNATTSNWTLAPEGRYAAFSGINMTVVVQQIPPEQFLFPVQPMNRFGIGNNFVYRPGPNCYAYDLDVRNYPRGTYTLKMYSNRYAASQVSFTVK